MLERLAPLGIDFVEQPVRETPIAQMRELRQVSPIPICANEGLWSEADAYARIVARQADVFCFSPFWVGSVSAFHRLAHVAHLEGLQVCKHTHGELGIAAAAAQHVLLTLPNIVQGNQQTSNLLAGGHHEPAAADRDRPRVGGDRGARARRRDRSRRTRARPRALPTPRTVPAVDAGDRSRGAISQATRRGEHALNYRRLGNSGLRVSELSLGTMTFGGTGDFAKVGATDLDGARRQIDMCLDAGVNLIDTADIYSDGLSEEIIGTALEGRRDRVLLATKARFRTGPGINDVGLSRHHLLDACDASLRRLRTDHIDILYMHEWDGQTPLEETLEAIDQLVRDGKVRYIACSNFSGWQLMKTLWTADRNHLAATRRAADLLHAAGTHRRVRTDPRRARPGSSA